jgi:hypothetical protein
MATPHTLTPPPAAPRKNPSPRLWSADEFRRIQEFGIFNGHAVELDRGTVVRSDTGEPFAFTRRDAYRLDDAGFFRNQRVQLIRGVIWEDTSVMNPPHAVAIRCVTKALERVFATGFDVRAQLPLDLGLDTEPHPDVAVVAGSHRDFALAHPKAALLVVEVSESTLDTDTHEKMSLYAAAVIPEDWVIDLTTSRLLVLRDPRAEANQPFGSAYGRVEAFDRDGTVAPLAAPAARIAVADLMP